MGLIEQKGKGTWIARYVDANGRERFLSFGTYLEAAVEFIANAGPTNQRTTTGELPVEALIGWFEKQKTAEGLKSVGGVADALRLRVVPLIGNRRIDSIKSADQISLINSLTVRSAGGMRSMPTRQGESEEKLSYARARDLASLLGRVYRFAYLKGKIATNPLPRGYGREANKAPGYLPAPAKALTDPIRYIDDSSHAETRRIAPAHLRAGLDLMTDGINHAEVNGLADGDIDFERATATIRNVWTRNGLCPASARKQRTVALSTETLASLLRLELVKFRRNEVVDGRVGLLLPLPVTASALSYARHSHGLSVKRLESGAIKPSYNLTQTFNRTLVKRARATRDPVSLARLVGIKNPAHIANKLRAEFRRGRHADSMRNKVSGKVFATLRSTL